MTLHICPRCKRVFAVMPGAGNSDFVHNCDSGNTTLDEEDVFNLSGGQWNWRGIENSLSPRAIIEGEDFEGVTKRGLRKTSFRQEPHQEFIEFNKNG